MNTVLIIAPHGDDELNLLGTIADRFIKNKWNIHLMLVTNGDYIPKDFKQRHNETEAVAMKMGISKVIHLGYGDDPALTGTHTYHTEAPAVCTTPSGHDHTYGPDGSPEYTYQVRGVHHAYCRDNVKKDMAECILSEHADVIVCVDLDVHPDHRMVSLLFDESLREILINTTYRPIVLKKFAYAGVWFGPDDYFANPMAETRLTPEETFPYTPEQAIRVRVSRKNYPIFYKRSPVYKLCELYRSQYVTEHFASMVNADALYFYRDCSNLAIRSRIQASSGEVSYLNDGKLADVFPINKESSHIISDYETYTWIPSGEDHSPFVEFLFHTEVSIQELRLHLPYQEEYRPVKIRIATENSEKILSIGQNLMEPIFFDPPLVNTKKLVLQILDGAFGKCGIREIEIFDHPVIFPWEALPLTPYDPNSLSRYRPGSTLMPRITHGLKIIRLFLTQDLRHNGIKYYFIRLCRKLWRK